MTPQPGPTTDTIEDTALRPLVDVDSAVAVGVGWSIATSGFDRQAPLDPCRALFRAY